MPPGTCPGAAPSDAGGPDWSLAEHVGHIADWQELAERLHGPRARDRRAGRPTATTTTATSTATTSAAASRGRRCRATTILGRLEAARPRAARARPAAVARDDPRVDGRGAGSTRRCTATISTTSRSSSRGPTRSASARSTAIRSWPTRGRPMPPTSSPRTAAIAADFDRLVRPIPPERWRGGRRDARLGPRRPRRRTSPTGPTRPRARSRIHRAARAPGWPTRPKASMPGTPGWSSATGTSPAADGPRALRPVAGRAAGRRRDADGRRPALARRLELGLRLPPRPRPQAPRDARPVVRRGRPPGRDG